MSRIFLHLKQQFLSQNAKVHILVILGILFLVVFLVRFIYHSFMYVSTDDAFIEGHIIPISAKVANHVDAVLVTDNQRVKRGEPLVQLDDRDFTVRLAMAQAQLDAARAEAEQARRDVERYQKLSETDEISKQQLDAALSREAVTTAQVHDTTAQVEQAQLQLSYTLITAPMDGSVSRKEVEVGAYVKAGQYLMALVAPKKWVVANFKETQLTHLRPGQKVTITIDTYPGKVFTGHIDSIQRGTGAQFSLLPPENATGNFVKVVQRIPVKIVFDDEPEKDYFLAVGMSVIPRVKIR